MPRKPTHADAELLLRLYEIRRDPDLRRARQWLLSEFRAQDWSEVQERYLTHDDADRWFRMATSYWEMVGTLVNRGVLHEELFFDHTGEDLFAWKAIAHLMPGARKAIRPSYLIQFERMVKKHEAHRARMNAEVPAEQGGSKPRRSARRAR